LWDSSGAMRATTTPRRRSGMRSTAATRAGGASPRRTARTSSPPRRRAAGRARRPGASAEGCEARAAPSSGSCSSMLSRRGANYIRRAAEDALRRQRETRARGRSLRGVVAGADRAENVERQAAYGLAFTDWLACACAGAPERASRAMRAAGDDLAAQVAFVATAGHVLDYDDTFADGVAHVSAACAPAALVVAAQLGLALGEALDAYAEGFEAMSTLAAA